MHVFLLILLISIFIISGCSSASKHIAFKSQSSSTDVFRVVSIDAGPPPKGKADLILRASIKVPPRGYYLLDLRNDYERRGYPFTIAVDGQSVNWRVSGEEDVTPLYDAQGKRRTAPEAGAGVLFSLQKRIRLSPGTYTVFVGLGEENYFKEFGVVLEENQVHIVELKPVYRSLTRPYRIPSFYRGLSDFEVIMGRRLLHGELHP